jgi:hypothetical protein
MVKYSPTGIRTIVTNIPSWSFGIVNDKEGNIYFSEGNILNFIHATRVFKLDASGKKTTIAGTGLVGF